MWYAVITKDRINKLNSVKSITTEAHQLRFNIIPQVEIIMLGKYQSCQITITYQIEIIYFFVQTLISFTQAFSSSILSIYNVIIITVYRLILT